MNRVSTDVPEGSTWWAKSFCSETPLLRCSSLTDGLTYLLSDPSELGDDLLLDETEAHGQDRHPCNTEQRASSESVDTGAGDDVSIEGAGCVERNIPANPSQLADTGKISLMPDITTCSSVVLVLFYHNGNRQLSENLFSRHSSHC